MNDEQLHTPADGGEQQALGPYLTESDRPAARHRQTAIALRDSERFLRSTLDALSAHIAILDEQGTIVRVNRAWREFARSNALGSPGFAVGASYLDVCRQARGPQAEGAAEVAAGIRAVLDGREASYVREYPCHGPSESRWFVVRVSRIDGDGPACAVVAHENVTERVLSVERLRFLAQAGEALAASLDVEATLARAARLAVPVLADLCVVDMPQGDILVPIAVAHADPRAEELLRDMRRRFPVRSDSPAPVARVARSGEPLLFATVPDSLQRAISQADAHYDMLRALHYESAMVVPLVGRGEILGTIMLLSVTPERRFDAGDLALAEEFARRAATAIDNARLYEAEREARAAAEAAVRVRDDFLSIAAHELRTPLTTVKGFAQMLARQLRAPQPDPERVLTFLIALEGQVLRLEALIADLLDITRIGQGRLALRPGPCDLAALAGRVLQGFESVPERTERHRLVLDAPAPLVGDWDEGRLEQVAVNLLSNALKYSSDGGEIRVSVHFDGHEALLSVRDEGSGIGPADRERLFQPFVRSPEARRQVSGSGLGLFISARIVEAHGGRIDVESAPGRGSTFTVQLPLDPAADAHGGTP